MAEFLGNMKRTDYCGTLTEKDIGREVCVMGWAQRQRDLGSLIFIDLRDRSGIIQLVIDPDSEVYDLASGLKNEYVVIGIGINILNPDNDFLVFRIVIYHLL